MNFSAINEEIRPLDSAAMQKARDHWNNIAKPVGSLGKLEDAVVKLAGITGDADVRLDKRAVLVLCADNGVIKQGVAQTPGEITVTMAGFIAQGQSSVGCMAKAAGAEVIAVDMGMASGLEMAGMLDRRIASATQDISAGPAMTRQQAEQAIQTGIELVADCKARGFDIIATGEMGIGNTTTSSAVASVLLGRPAEEMTGRGAGLSDEGYMRKKAVIARAIELNKPDRNDAADVLHKLGGFDIAGLCGVFIGGALYRVPIIVDGLISAVSALAAVRLCPNAAPYLFASHVSAEPASLLLLKELGVEPLVHADMRLGEGTGAVTLLPLLDMALSVYRNLMTFAQIGM